ncbi:MAG: DUF1015 family protein [Gemmatimonadetes bacterium]|nr:DUF1015 family protein [Gemmatimonadota bacterium]NIO30639.1 DUF1015 family protein [Gemmatimonadota bacterium]
MTARVAPFRALRYRSDRVAGLDAVLAPPYDVIGPEQAAQLRGRSPHNIAHITNPVGDGPERYERAARTLESWVEDGVLARAARTAFYVHKHHFSSDDQTFVRTGVWAALRLAAYDEGIVLPHERTMKGPKADRLALMRACRAHLSPVFFICSDAEARVAGLLGQLTEGEPTERAEFPAGQAHELWNVEEREILDELAGALNEQNFLIADGHHRYETALAYRDEVGSADTGPGRAAHEFLLAYIVPESDPGLLLLPTHRTIGGEPLNWSGAALDAASDFEVIRLADVDVDLAQQALEEEAGRPTFMLVARSEPGGWLMRARKPGALRGISSVALHDVFLSGCLGLSAEEQLGRIGYVKEVGAALEAVRSGAVQAAALLAAPLVSQVREAAAAGERTPAKTTYFWPKVPTGIAIHVVDE